MSAPASLVAGPWRVVFTWQGDRYAHAVFRAPGGAAILESIEASPDDDWPPSPALQQLHVEQRAGGQKVALLVGMSAGSHWSLSVTLDPAAGRLTFDAACRLREPPRRLGSAYCWLETAVGRPPAIEAIHAPPAIDPSQCPLAIDPIDGDAARLVVLAERRLAWRAGEIATIVIEPPPASGPWPRTVRWRYVAGGVTR